MKKAGILLLSALLTGAAALLIVGIRKHRTGVPVLCCTDSEMVFYQPLVERYEETRGAKITLLSVDDDSYDPRKATGKADIVSVPVPAELMEAEQKRLFADIGSALETDSFVLLPEGSNENTGLFCLPISLDAPVILYNEKILSDRGLSVEGKLQDITEAGLVLGEEGIVPFALARDADGRWDVGALTEGVLLAEVPETEESGGLADGVYDLIVFANQIRPYMTEKGQAPGNIRELLSAFGQGELAITVVELSELRLLPETDESWRIAPFTGTGLQYRAPCFPGRSLAISRKTGRRDAAEDFLAFLVSEETQQFMYDMSGELPAVGGIQVSESLEPVYLLLSIPGGSRAALFSCITAAQRESCLTLVDSFFETEQEAEAAEEQFRAVLHEDGN